MNDYAVVVGINNYPAFDPLEGPVKDAKAFRNWLVEHGNVPPENIREVYSTDFESHNVPTALTQPAIDAVNAKFRQLADLTRNNFQKLPRVGRRLYIYLAGHGITPRVTSNNLDSAALLMANADLGSTGLHLAGPAYAEWFRQSHAFEEIVLFMDCCRNVADDIEQAPVPFTPVRGGDPTKVKTLNVLATQWDAPSFEQPLGSPPEPRGVFTYALLEVLKSGAGKDNGKLTALGLKGALQLLISNLREGDVPQFPRFNLGNLDDIVLFESGTGATLPKVTIEWDPPLHGKTGDVRDGNDNPLTPPVNVTASATNTQLSIKPGLYSVRFSDGVEAVLKVRPGLSNDAQEVGRVTVE
jgi:Caspase domain